MAEQDNEQNFFERLLDPSKDKREFQEKFKASKFSKYPELKNFKYTNTEGGETRARQEYIAAVEDFFKEPKRSDFKNETSYQQALSFWKTAAGRMLRLSYTDLSGKENTPADRIRKHIDDQKKKIAERSTTSEGQQEQTALTALQETKKVAQQKTIVEQSRTEALKNVAIPSSQEVFGGTADRPRTVKRESLLTNSDWLSQWATMTPTQKENFKSQLSESLGDSPQAASIRSLDVNSEQLLQTWQSYGIYLSESYRENKATPRAMTPESFANYVTKSGTFDAKESDQVTYEQSVTDFYRSNGLPMAPSIIKDITRRLSNGALDLEVWKQSQRKLLAKEYPDWADELSSGLDIKDLANNYVSQMASVLEIDAETIDLNNSLIKNALQTRTPDGKLTTKTLREFELDLRKDPRWKQTQVGQQEATDVAQTILKQFGFRS